MYMCIQILCIGFFNIFQIFSASECEMYCKCRIHILESSLWKRNIVQQTYSPYSATLQQTYSAISMYEYIMLHHAW